MARSPSNNHVQFHVVLCPVFNSHLLLLNAPQIFGQIVDQIFGQVFDQIFGQGFDQGFGLGESHKYSEQYCPVEGKPFKNQ